MDEKAGVGQKTMIHKLDSGGYAISSYRVWRPGAYESERAAKYAFRFTDEELQALQDKVNANPDITKRLITFKTLQAVREMASLIRKGKLQCRECGLHCHSGDVEFLDDPKEIGNGWQICPHCRSASSMDVVCEFGDCKNQATCGAVFGCGYVHCCGKCLRKWRGDLAS